MGHHTEHVRIKHVCTLSLFISVQAQWRDLEFCIHVNHAELNMKTTVRTAESACTPKTVTNLSACKNLQHIRIYRCRVKHISQSCWFSFYSEYLSAMICNINFISTFTCWFVFALECTHISLCLFCSCPSAYSGTRCHFFSPVETYAPPELEKLIGITFGVMMLIVILAIVFYCCAYKK